MRAPQKPAGRPLTANQENGLAAQIEKIQLNKNQPEPSVEEEDDEIFSRLSIMDKTAYKIARRLLAAGAEIHVVARKLDLPVSEIRLLDRLMREHGEAKIKETEAGPNYKPTETIPRKKDCQGAHVCFCRAEARARKREGSSCGGTVYRAIG